MSNLAALSDGSALRSAIYTRVSTDEQATEGYSLAEQERRGLAYIEQEGWTYVQTFEERGVSGKHASRPALDALRAQLDEVDVVIVSSLDRLGRSTAHLLRLYDEFEKRGVRLVFLRERLDTTTAIGRLLRTVLSAISEFERELGEERTSAGIGSRARAGKPWGAPAYGYAKGGDGHWIPASREEAIVLRMFRERVEAGRSYQSIATALNCEGVPARRGAWTATTVRKILTGRYVLGEFSHKGDWIRGQHRPIIDVATWEAAQALAEQGRKYAPSRGGRRAPLHLFTSHLLRCGECFEAMLPRSDGDHYVCRTNKQLKGAGACAMPPQRREDVDRAALALFERWFFDLDATRQRMTDDLDAHLREVESQCARAEHEIGEKAVQYARVERDYLAGKLPAERAMTWLERLGSERGAAEAERDRLAANAATIRSHRRDLDGESDLLHRLAALRESVVATVRDAQQTQDIDALRRAIAQSFVRVWIQRDGNLVINAEALFDPDPKIALPLSQRNPTVQSTGVPE